MIYPKKLIRLLKIHRSLHRCGLSIWLISFTKLKFLNYFTFLMPWLWFTNSNYKNDGKFIDFRQSLEQLGTIFIKFGQLLSTRADLVGVKLSQELSQLQDNCQPFASNLAVKIIENDLQAPIKDLFLHFDTEPINAASIAQIHTAQLNDKTAVVVKVVRPDIKKKIVFDLQVLKELISFINYIAFDTVKNLRLVEIVLEIEKTLLNEMDMMREGANGNFHRRNWQGSDLLYVPKSYLELSSKNVLVQERIYGIKIDDIEAIKAAGIDIKTLAKNGVTIFFNQVFYNNFFHADMHPGNILVLEDGRYSGVDFGIMGSLAYEDQQYLARNLVAFFEQDYRLLAELHIQSKWVDSNVRVEELEAAFRTVAEPIVDKPLKEISFGLFLIRLFETARKFGMKVQPQLVLLQKTIFAIEGLGRRLDGDLDLLKIAKPILKKWLAQQLGIRNTLDRTRKKMPMWLNKLPDLPDNLISQLQRAQNTQQLLLDEIKELRLVNAKNCKSNLFTQRTIIVAIAVLIMYIIFNHQ